MNPPFFMALGYKRTKTLGSAIAEGKVNRMDDLISRDKLIINMNDAKAILHMFQFPKDQIDVAEIVADAMIYNVRKAPTIDAVPVVHGHWIHTGLINAYGGHQHKCSVCGYELMVSPMCDNENYCCNCGSKMDVRKGEQE